MQFPARVTDSAQSSPEIQREISLRITLAASCDLERDGWLTRPSHGAKPNIGDPNCWSRSAECLHLNGIILLLIYFAWYQSILLRLVIFMLLYFGNSQHSHQVVVRSKIVACAINASTIYLYNRSPNNIVICLNCTECWVFVPRNTRAVIVK